jgi:hypothetical protein
LGKYKQQQETLQERIFVEFRFFCFDRRKNSHDDIPALVSGAGWVLVLLSCRPAGGSFFIFLGEKGGQFRIDKAPDSFVDKGGTRVARGFGQQFQFLPGFPVQTEDDGFHDKMLQVVSSIDDFLFSGKEDELFMQGVYSHGTGPK